MRNLLRASCFCLAAAVLAGLAAAEDAAEEKPLAPTGESASADGPAADDIQVPPPPFSEGIFPCSDCHEGEPNRTVREVEDHEVVLNHNPRIWCLDCHDPIDRDRLRLASGEKVDFSHSWRLCGQCHGPKLRDWKAGVHGKRTGSWNGKKQYLLCAHCHEPHSPKFKPIKPLPPPTRPERLR